MSTQYATQKKKKTKSDAFQKNIMFPFIYTHRQIDTYLPRQFDEEVVQDNWRRVCKNKIIIIDDPAEY